MNFETVIAVTLVVSVYTVLTVYVGGFLIQLLDPIEESESSVQARAEHSPNL